MTSAWPWLAVAGAGALHGLNPATGWMLAVARELRSGDGRAVWRTLAPIAVGHAGSVVLVAVAVGGAPYWTDRLLDPLLDVPKSALEASLGFS